MTDLKALVDRTKDNVAQIVARIDDLMEITGLEETDLEAFMASNQEWIRGLVDKLILVHRRLQLQMPEPPTSERGPGLTNEALVMAIDKVLRARAEREPVTTVKVVFPKLKLQEMKAFSWQ